jgi:peptidoglycan biosynthesis protein MviN/MurJ (putative lipid II flippase)
MEYSFSKFFSIPVLFGCSLIKDRETKKNCLETVLRMVSVAVACLLTAVSLLLLAALFMQISGVSLALTWSGRLCLLIVLLCGSLCYKLSPFQAHWER